MVVEAKQLSREHYSENLRLTKTNPTQMGVLGYSGRVDSSWYTSETRRVTFVKNAVISHARRKDWICDYDNQNISVVISETNTSNG